ncbi:MAG: hypothetical protein JSW34_03975 [Candidatus Zixiibacteriota bacterium]|nr:MAG: hypothetical protein JSW34_03975 [candidate division Zixibacteria bacterium]
MKAGFVVLAILAGVAAVKAQEVFEEEGSLYSTRELEKSVKAAEGSKVVVKSALSLQGSLDIRTWDEPSAKLVYRKKAKAAERSKAIDYIDLIGVNLETVRGVLFLALKAPNPAPWQGTEVGIVKVELFIPEQCQVEIEAQYFDIKADGPFKSLVVPSSLGRLDVTHVTERLELSTSNRRVNIENVAGKINVSTTNSDLVAINIKGADSRSVFRNESGDIKILGVTGELNVKNDYGRITIDGFAATGKKSYVRGLYAPISVAVVEMGGGQLVMSNRFEDIELTLPSDVSAVLSLAVEEEGQIEIANLLVKPDLIQRNRLNLIAGDGEALITGSTRGEGNVYVRGVNQED